MLIKNLHSNHLELLAQLPREQLAALLALQAEPGDNTAELRNRLQEILGQVDWTSKPELLGRLTSELLPIEQLVPACYADWRPIITDAISFIGSRLGSQRLIPKLIDLLLLAEDSAVETRLSCFIARMPSLQKLGQVIARNRNLEPTLRLELTKLENEIRDVEADRIKAIIEQQLGPLLKQYNVEVENEIFAEASVCALLRFSWLNPDTHNNEQGVFKVLKPHIKEYFAEEMILLQGLADFFDTSKDQHVLTEVNLRSVFEDIRNLLEGELDSAQESQNLEAAYQRYQDTKQVRIPQLITRLSAPGIIAMSYEPGRKITDAFTRQKTRQRDLSRRLIEALIAQPLFASEENAIFHADPHAGNLFVNTTTHELIIFDWALTESLSREQRRKIILLMSAVYLRDADLINQAINELREDTIKERNETRDIQRATIKQFINTLPLYTLPTSKDVLALLDEIMLSGINFSSSLLMFRKVLLTLDGVLHDLDDVATIDSILSHYVIENMRNEICGMHYLSPQQPDFAIPLSNNDTLAIALSAQWYYFRSAWQTSAHWFNSGR